MYLYYPRQDINLHTNSNEPIENIIPFVSLIIDF
jgi:hypothetical protein